MEGPGWLDSLEGTEGELQGIGSRPDLNGRRVEVAARVTGRDGAPRLAVRLLSGAGAGEVLKVKLGSLKLLGLQEPMEWTPAAVVAPEDRRDWAGLPAAALATERRRRAKKSKKGKKKGAGPVGGSCRPSAERQNLPARLKPAPGFVHPSCVEVGTDQSRHLGEAGWGPCTVCDAVFKDGTGPSGGPVVENLNEPIVDLVSACGACGGKGGGRGD